MATFFKRRYMRPEFGSTEKVLGVVLLVIVAGIVGAYINQSLTNREYLFIADPTTKQDAEPDLEQAVGERLLPSLVESGWQPAAAVEVLSAEELPKLGEVGKDAAAFGAVRAFRRKYQNAQDTREKIKVTMTDAETPQQALGLCDARRTEGAQPMTIGRDGWRNDQRAGFWSGRYYTELWTPVESIDMTAALEAVAGALAARQLSYGVAPSTETTQPTGEGVVPKAADNPFPDSGVSGWRPPNRVARFTAENLYEKIDGRVGLYLQFHVVGLTFGTYFHKTDREKTIDVYWYDMGSDESALGIFGAEAPENAAPLDIGQRAYQTGGAVFFVKGPSYVQVLPTDSTQIGEETSLALARRIADAIRDAGGGPWALDVLPREGRVEGSFEFLATDVFDLDFLRDVFTAEYDREGGRITMFIHRAEDEASAGDLFEKYIAFFRENGEIVWTDPDGTRRIAAGEVGGVIDVVFAKGRYLGGVAGAEDSEPAKNAAVEFYSLLKAP